MNVVLLLNFRDPIEAFRAALKRRPPYTLPKLTLPFKGLSAERTYLYCVSLRTHYGKIEAGLTGVRSAPDL